MGVPRRGPGPQYLGEPLGTPIHLSERFSRFVNHLGANDGSVQASLDRLAEDLALPKDALRRIIDRALKLGVIRVDTHGTYIGMGRAPNSYHLRFDWSEWPKVRQAFADKLRAENQERIRRAELAKAEARAEATRRRMAAKRAPKRVWPPPPPPVVDQVLEQRAADESLDVDAWLEVSDF